METNLFLSVKNWNEISSELFYRRLFCRVLTKSWIFYDTTPCLTTRGNSKKIQTELLKSNLNCKALSALQCFLFLGNCSIKKNSIFVYGKNGEKFN